MPSQYLTVAELLAAPLGLSLKSTVPAPFSTGPAGVTGAQTYEELTNVVIRASTMADSYCQQVLGTTTDTEEKRTDGFLAGIDQHGYLWVHTDYWPVISVSSFQYGYPQLGGTTWTVAALADLILERTRIVYPTALPRRGTPPLRVQYTYLNGWPTTTLTGAVTAGATSLPVADATGLVAGGKLTVSDLGNTEVVTVAAGWTAATGAQSVTLAAGTAFAHTPIARPATAPAQPYDVGVSALPADIKEAVLLIVKELIDVRGSTALVMGRAGGVQGQQAQGGKGPTDELIGYEAQCLLDRYRRIL